MINLALLISGGGSTASAILEACKAGGRLHGLVTPKVVVASKRSAGGIKRAIEAGMNPVDVVVISPKQFSLDDEFGKALLAAFSERGVDLLMQAGWLPITPCNVVRAYRGCASNQHNAPLDPGHPHFGGAGMYGSRNVCARLLYARKTGDPNDQFTEAQTHYVTEVVDDGQVIGRARVDILPDDDVASLQQRLLVVEHELQIDVLERFARGKVVPLVREERLVPESRIPLLIDCKAVARLLYPHG